ncbi:ABC transporter ATP-binding protein [Kiritimatiella glycovorans]|uniref:Bacitracin export ATP-binding protein BceA n=1 Tax=Kiritimatiella glycovorans TaxID=1307763 RepID=A0A0G3EEG0_9BACT|nr:ABC transporter ATP-binding protein [Kiritimatiella glycovorans]AKJ64811.1 Bacitracin export ATP-binding protein BceA [Kiritimatiella glycovorans]
MSDVLIHCHKLTKHYRKGPRTVTPLEALDLDIERGDFVSLMGPSGSGKTTLLNLIAGIDTPSEGVLEVCGEDITRLSRGRLARWRAHHVGYIFQLYHLVPVLTAFENVELPLLLDDISRRERRERVEQTLAMVGLGDRMHHYPRELSGGQEQRVAIARALVASPELLVADEPTGDLDREAGDAVLALLQNLRAEHNKTIVMVTHDPHAADASARVLHLEKGQLLEAQHA